MQAPPPPPPIDPSIAQNEEIQKNLKNRARASTMLTGARGVTTSGTTTGRTLLGA